MCIWIIIGQILWIDLHFYLFLGHMAACHNLSLMYRKGDGVDQDKVKADKYMHKAQDIHEQLTKERERIKFQEGVESAGGAPLQHWLLIAFKK